MDYEIETGKWYEIPENDGVYPFDGRTVYLTDNGSDVHIGYWRKTRTYDAENVKWVEEGFWAQRNAGGQRLGIAPNAFMFFEE